MNVFEVVLPGFDGSTDETDDRILWIEAADMAADMAAVTRRLPCALIGRNMAPGAVDYSLPRDAERVTAALSREER